MRYTNGHDLETGELVGRKDARAKTDETRYSHIFNCLGCKTATFHWRKEVHAKENTEYRFPTFVRNGSTSHEKNCHYDYKNFVRQHRDIAFNKDDFINLRIQFPFGAALADKKPWLPGILSHKQKQAANGNLDKRHFKSLHELVDFIEKNMGGLRDSMMSDVRLYYQGETQEWDNLWVDASHYSKLLDKSRQFDAAKRQLPVLVLVKPNHEGGRTQNGKRKFVCQVENAGLDSTLDKVRPSLVCFDDAMVKHLKTVARLNKTILVASRPFQPEVHHNNIKNVYLSVVKMSQLACVDNKYWQPVLTQDRQLVLGLG